MDANGTLLYIAPKHAEAGAMQSLQRLMAHEMIHVFQPAMLAGKTVVPVAGAFGRCVVARPVTIGVFDLSYGKTPKTNVIASVTVGSNAERAGLRVGDRIVGPSLMTPVGNDASRTLQLPIERGSRTMTINFLPRTGAVDALRWSLASDHSCGRAVPG